MDNIHIFCGKDKFSVNNHIKSIIDKYENPAIIRLESSDFNVDRAIDEIRFKDLFNLNKIIIMEYDIFHEDKKIQDLFVMALKDMPIENIVIFICPKVLKGSSIYKKIFSKFGNILIHEPPKGNNKKDFVNYISKVLKDIKVDNNCIYLMIDLMGFEVSNILFEIQRLYCRFNKINEKIIKENIPKTYFNMFDLMDSFCERDLKKTLTIYDMFIEYKYNFHEIFISLYRQIRLMFMIRILMKDHGMKDSRYIANILKAHPFQVRKNMITINNYSYNELSNAFQIMVDFQRKMYNNSNSCDMILKVMVTNIML